MRRPRRRRPGPFLATLTVLVLTVLSGACGGGSGGDGVATLGGENAAGAGDTGKVRDDEPTEAERQEAFRKYARCMREHGVDMPDPQFDGDGGVMIDGAAAGESAAQAPEQFEAADEACRKHLDGAIDGRREEMDPQAEQEMQAQALAFATCMREHGVDMPDPQFGSEGRGFTVSLGSPDGGGIDPNDPTFQDAQETCSEEVGMDLPRGGKGGPGGGFSVGTTGAR
jgi:hypothetical protein